MITPIYDFVRIYSESVPVRAHMPGHKGALRSDEISKLFPFDITEIQGADSIFDPNGIIMESEENASKLFGTHKTLFSTSGSTLSIQTALALTCREGDTVLASRNAHRSFINSCILLGISVKWIYPQDGNGSLNSEIIKKKLGNGNFPRAVFITSPDYLGKIADINSISDFCRNLRMPLIVDNAHGSYLKFLETDLHPISQGADLCCDSAHKTLPVLTGGAYLHIANTSFSERAKEYMSLFASSSPSYLILQSLDLCNDYLENGFRYDLSLACKRTDLLKERIKDKWTAVQSEPLKLVIDASANGLKGTDLAGILRGNGIECEYSDRKYTVLMFSAASSENDFLRTCAALDNASKYGGDPVAQTDCFLFPELETVLTPREAFFADKESIPVESCKGRISAGTVSPCPPGIPVSVCGERFSEESIKFLKNYSISYVNVVK